MTRIKWRKSNPYFKSLEAEQQRRLSKCGWDARNNYNCIHDTIYNLIGSLYTIRKNRCAKPLRISDSIKRQMI